jgi:hypothetical protein
MKELKTSFMLNGLLYTLIYRNEVVALYGILGTYSEEIINCEVDVIYIRNDKYGEREAIADIDTFGRDRSRCFKSKALADEYFEKLTSDLRIERNLSQGVAKVIAGVAIESELIPEYQPA